MTLPRSPRAPGRSYRAEMTDSESGERTTVILKKAKEFGEAEAWMNERMMRAAPQAVAQYVTAFSDGAGRVGDSTWLVWRYEGDYTLAEMMQVGGSVAVRAGNGVSLVEGMVAGSLRGGL